MAAKNQHVVETTFINEWAETGVYNVKVNGPVSEQMLRHRIDLLDINMILRTGRVVRSGMFGSQGLWNVRGHTADAHKLEIVITVISAFNEVELLRIVSVQRR